MLLHVPDDELVREGARRRVGGHFAQRRTLLLRTRRHVGRRIATDGAAVASGPILESRAGSGREPGEREREEKREQDARREGTRGRRSASVCVGLLGGRRVRSPGETRDERGADRVRGSRPKTAARTALRRRRRRRRCRCVVRCVAAERHSLRVSSPVPSHRAPAAFSLRILAHSSERSAKRRSLKLSACLILD